MNALASAPTSQQTRICPLCEASCGLKIEVQNNTIIRIRGDESDVLSKGYICPKAAALKDLHEDPDRLRQPLIKRKGVFEPATWDEAFALIAQRLGDIKTQHGPNAIGLTLGNPSSHKMGLILYIPRLARALGTKQVFSASSLDQVPKQLASGLMFGHWLSVAVPDIERTQLLIVIGANPMASNGSMWTVPNFRGKAKDLLARGGRMVVIDPRRTETAAVASVHHFIEPGGDVYLLLGMLHTVFNEGLIAHSRLQRLLPHLNGLAELQAEFVGNTSYAPERMAARCGIAAATMRQLARDLAATPQAALYGRLGTCTQRYGSLNAWLIDVLNVVCGHMDGAGGVMFPLAAAFAANAPISTNTPNTAEAAPAPSPQSKGIRTGKHHSRVSAAPEVMGEFPMNCLAEEIETEGTGQIRALISIASNPVLSAPNGQRIAAALSTLDFMVSVDIYLNETTRHADVILPGLSPLEEPHYDVIFNQLSVRNQARYSHAVLPKPAAALADWEILTRLTAIAKGQVHNTNPTALNEEWFTNEIPHHPDAAVAQSYLQQLQQTPPAQRPAGATLWLDWALRTGPYANMNLPVLQASSESGGIDLGELQPRLPQLLRTASGKIELAPELLMLDLQTLKNQLETTLPRAASASAHPSDTATGQSQPSQQGLKGVNLRLIGRRDVRSNNSWMHNLPSLAKGPDRSMAWIHPADAQRLMDDWQDTAGTPNKPHISLPDIRAEKSFTIHITSPATGVQQLVQAQVRDEVMQGLLCLPHGWGHDLEGAQLRVAAQRPGVNLNALLGDTVRDPLSGNAVLSGQSVWVSLLAEQAISTAHA